MRIQWVLIFVIISFLISCSESPQKVYEKAENIGTIQSYANFVESHPNTEFTQLAKEKLWSLEFKKAKNNNSVDSFSYFVTKYPDSKHFNDAQKILWELEFRNVKTTASTEGYEQFIKKYPNATQVEKAKSRLKVLRLIGTQVTWNENTFWQDSSGGWMINLASNGGIKKYFDVQNIGIVKEVYETDILVEIKIASILNRKRSISGVEQEHYNNAINSRIGKTVRVPKFKLNID